MRLRRLEQSEQTMQSFNLQVSFRPVSIKLGSIQAVLSMARLLAASGHAGFLDNVLHPTYFTQKAGEALRVTRWFRHE